MTTHDILKKDAAIMVAIARDQRVSNHDKVDEMNEKMRTQDDVNSAIKKGGHFCAQHVGPNYLFETMGHVCAYEYCIETQPLHPTADGTKSCPIFGHDCPGGEWQAFYCRTNNYRPRRHEYTPITPPLPEEVETIRETVRQQAEYIDRHHMNDD